MIFNGIEICTNNSTNTQTHSYTIHNFSNCENNLYYLKRLNWFLILPSTNTSNFGRPAYVAPFDGSAPHGPTGPGPSQRNTHPVASFSRNPHPVASLAAVVRRQPPRPRSRRLLRRSLASLLPSPRLSAFHHPHNHNPTRRKGIPFSAKRSNLPARAAVLRRSSSFHMTTACVAAPLSRGHQSRRLEEGRAVLGPQMWSPGRKSGAPPDARDTTSP
jgi:hypothetical protein